MKNCRKCKEDKRDYEFSKCSRNKDGLTSYCKYCISKSSKNWYIRNKEHKDRKSREWLKENGERFKEYRAAWEEENRYRRKKYLSEWYQLNKTEISKKHREWWDSNPDKRRLYKHKYYVSLKDQMGVVSPDIIEKLSKEQDGMCYYCQEKLDKWHLEYMVPVSRGGLHDDKNLCLSCPFCNLRKHTKTVEEFLAEKEEI